MRIFRVCIKVFVCLAVMLPHAYASEESPACGTVSGTIKVWKTKVKTKGSKSDKDVVVFLKSKTVKAPPATGKTVQMDQRGLVFIPHVLAVQKGTTATFLNNDSEKHNVYFLYDKTGETLDLGTWEQGQSVDYTFNDTGVIITLCKLHLEMAAHIIVLDTPYFCQAVIDDNTQNASFEIDNVPPGNYILSVWHKKLKMKGIQAEVTVEKGKTTNLDVVITKQKYVK